MTVETIAAIPAVLSDSAAFCRREPISRVIVNGTVKNVWVSMVVLLFLTFQFLLFIIPFSIFTVANVFPS